MFQKAGRSDGIGRILDQGDAVCAGFAGAGNPGAGLLAGNLDPGLLVEIIILELTSCSACLLALH